MANFTTYNSGTMTAATLVNALLAANSNLTIDPASIQLVYGTSSSYTSDATGNYTYVDTPSVSLYDGGLSELGIGAGVLLTSGSGNPAISNTSGSYTGSFETSNTDADLQAVANSAFSGAGTVRDVSSLQFSFTISDLYVQGISFDLIFGSDEYPEYSNTSYVDVAGIFLNGQNIALFNNQTNQPLSVINDNLSIGNFRNNSSYTSYGTTTLPAQAVLPIEYDGISNKLTINAALQPGVNTLKIAVGDTGDQAYDSGLFIANLTGTQLGGSGLTAVTTGTTGNDTVTGTDSNETFDCGAGDDIINPGLGDDIILAGLGNDIIYGGLGNNQIDGGDGNDTVIYTTSIKTTYIKIGANQTIKIGNASDTLLDVETIQFSDGSLNGDTLLIEDDIAKTYLAYFGRAADPAGIDWWVSDINAAMAQGQTYNQALQAVVDNFARSNEAQTIYPILATGTLDTAGLNSFVTNVYQNLFDRAPDAAGLAYWVAEAGQYQTQGLSAGSIIKTIINGAQDQPGQLDRTTVQNKAQATWYYAEQYELQNKTWDNSHYTEAQNILDGITSDLSSVNTVYAQIIGIVTA